MNHTSFSEMAGRLGIRPALLYSVKTVARVVGVEASTIYDEIAAGRLKCMLPEGRRQGKLIAPEWVEEWIEKGVRP